MPTATIASYLLALNAVWDVVTGSGLLVFAFTGRLRCLADTHLCLWIADQHKTDPVLSSLTGFVILQWGVTRALAAANLACRWPDATVSYAFEGIAIGIAATTGKMHGFPSMMVVATCLACAAIAVAAGFDP